MNNAQLLGNTYKALFYIEFKKYAMKQIIILCRQALQKKKNNIYIHHNNEQCWVVSFKFSKYPLSAPENVGLKPLEEDFFQWLTACELVSFGNGRLKFPFEIGENGILYLGAFRNINPLFRYLLRLFRHTLYNYRPVS